MGILFGFKAHDITTKIVDNIADANSTVVITTPLTVDPISDAVNNVRFAFNGFAADGDLAFLELRTRSFFSFRIPKASRITVNGHLTNLGVCTLTGRGKTWLFDHPGIARFFVVARMRVRLRGANGQIVFSRSSPELTVFDSFVSGDDATHTDTQTIAAGLMEEFLTVAPPDVVLPEDSIFVRMQHRIVALATDGGEFVVDFDSAGGGGLNVPMVVVDF